MIESAKEVKEMHLVLLFSCLSLSHSFHILLLTRSAVLLSGPLSYLYPQYTSPLLLSLFPLIITPRLHPDRLNSKL